MDLLTVAKLIIHRELNMLKAPVMAVTSPTDIDSDSRKLDVYYDAMNSVASKGLGFPTLPTHYKGEMPQDITQLDDSALGSLLGRLSEYCGYVEAELAKAEVMRISALAVYDNIRAKVRQLYKNYNSDTKLNAKDKDDLVEADPRVVEAKSKQLYTEAVHVLTKVILNKSQRDWDTVSRRITQRGQDMVRNQRGLNINSTAPNFGPQRFGRQA